MTSRPKTKISEARKIEEGKLKEAREFLRAAKAKKAEENPIGIDDEIKDCQEEVKHREELVEYFKSVTECSRCSFKIDDTDCDRAEQRMHHHGLKEHPNEVKDFKVG